MNQQELSTLLAELCSHSHETEWIEFKENNADPQKIGEYLSALSNSAALHRKETAYIVWGVENVTHNVVGTNFKPRQAKKGNEELENWMLRLLSPRIDVKIHEFQENGHEVVIFEIQPAQRTPVSFSGIEYIRVGSLKKKLKEYPEKERALWAIFSDTPFEKGTAVKGVGFDEVLSLIDYPSFFELIEQRLPDNRDGIIDRLKREKVVIEDSRSNFDITNLGGILFAKNLNNFERLARKALRVIQYKGKNRVETLREQVGGRGYAVGYAVGFEGAISFINTLLPQNEQIEQALRREVPIYPEIAIRELVANALIHQDFSMTGTGPTVELFDDRIEITNPGTPLIDTLRFIDEPPQSRNEKLAKFMRRMNICEERGSGIDKVISYVELFQLPPPEFLVTDNHTKAILFAPKSLNEMEKKDRIRACYQHACLRHVSNEQMTNTSFRERLGVEKQNYAKVSRYIRDTVEIGLVRAVDPNTSKKYMKYVPFWA